MGEKVVLRITGLRNPCAQLDNYQPGLMKACLDRDDAGTLVRKAGVMAVVEEGGSVYTNDSISVEYPPEPHEPLGRV